MPELLLRRCAVVVYTILEAYYNMGIGKRHALTFSSCHQPIYIYRIAPAANKRNVVSDPPHIILYRVHQQQDHDRHQRASRLRPYRVISEHIALVKNGPIQLRYAPVYDSDMLAGVVQPCSRLNKGYRCEIPGTILYLRHRLLLLS